MTAGEPNWLLIIWGGFIVIGGGLTSIAYWRWPAWFVRVSPDDPPTPPGRLGRIRESLEYRFGLEDYEPEYDKAVRQARQRGQIGLLVVGIMLLSFIATGLGWCR